MRCASIQDQKSTAAHFAFTSVVDSVHPSGDDSRLQMLRHRYKRSKIPYLTLHRSLWEYRLGWIIDHFRQVLTPRELAVVGFLAVVTNTINNYYPIMILIPGCEGLLLSLIDYRRSQLGATHERLLLHSRCQTHEYHYLPSLP